MKIIDQSHEILHITPNLLQQIETAGRTCYKSEEKITEGSAEKFVKMLINKGHEAMLEFGDITVKFITNRGISHELVRHRIGVSYSQESQRYVRYDNIEFIRPVWINCLMGSWSDKDIYLLSDDDPTDIYLKSCYDAERAYQKLLKDGWRPEQARDVLPNATKTEIVVKANVREVRHILHLRCSKQAHPQMRSLMLPLLQELHEKIPVLFDDLYLTYFSEKDESLNKD